MDDLKPGWIKPEKKLTLPELEVFIATKEAELAALKQEAYNLEYGPKLEALAQIRNIMRAQSLTVADIVGPEAVKNAKIYRKAIR